MSMRCVLFLLLIISELAYAKPVGLQNQGNTCYGNSIIQCLYNIQPITNFLLFNYRANRYPADSIAKKYVDLVYAMNNMPAESSANYRAAQEKFWSNELRAFTDRLAQIMNPGGGLYRQEDATEFFGKLIVSLIEDDKYDSTRTDAQLEQLKSQHPLGKIIKIDAPNIFKCPAVNYQTLEKRVQLYLTIPTESPQRELLTTLPKCLDAYFTKEAIEGYRVSNALPPQNCTKQYYIEKLSDVIVLMLNRFTFSMETFQSAKLEHDIEIPLTTSFRKYYASSPKGTPLYLYDLIAAAQHSGGTGGGHYIAHVKDEKTGVWYECNDSRISVENVQNVQAGVNQSYVLIYKKNKNKPDVEPAKQPARQPQAQQADELVRALEQLTQSLESLQDFLKP